MANDLEAMVFRIAAELGSRFDLAGAVGSATTSAPNAEAIRNAITTAITEYQKERFRFSDIDPSNPSTFATVATRSVYTNADLALISTAYAFDYVNILIGNTVQQLSRVTPERQHLNIQNNNQSGQPSSWAYEGNSLILYPVPDTAYTCTIGAHRNIAAPASDNEADNVWMTTAEGLIRSRAKFEILTHVTRNAALAAAMSPRADGNNGQPGATYGFWRSLKGEGNKVTGTGRIKPMAF